MALAAATQTMASQGVSQEGFPQETLSVFITVIFPPHVRVPTLVNVCLPSYPTRRFVICWMIGSSNSIVQQ